MVIITCPQAKPIPDSPIPCGQDKFNSRPSAPADSAIWLSFVQSSRLYEHIMLAIKILLGKSCFNSRILLIQYKSVFSEISSIFKNDPCSGPYKCLDVVPLIILGETLVTMSYDKNEIVILKWLISVLSRRENNSIGILLCTGRKSL